MAYKKKALNIGLLVDKANDVFENSSDDFVQGRNALQVFVSNILMETGNYEGFNYIQKEKMDNSRIMFYKHNNLMK